MLSGAVLLCGQTASAQTTTLTLQLDKPGHNVSPTLYGLMTEEINHSYDGGLYAETIRNRTFQDDWNKPVSWSLVQDANTDALIELDRHTPLNESLPVSLKFTVKKAGVRAGVANEGFWGFPVRPNTSYKGSFYAKAENGDHDFSVSLESKDGAKVYVKAEVTGVGTDWKKYDFTFTTAADAPVTADAQFVISTRQAGTYWIDLVSLFPPTYNNTPNGNRTDIMQLLSDMKPKFLRLPGGNYLEGDFFKDRFAWKQTLGALENRPGHQAPWGYRSSDGMGLLEYLEWCEDLHIEPVLAVFAGYTLKGDHVEGKLLQPFIDEALEEIEYVIGDTGTKWGAVRAKDGHPQPFPLQYIEVGNEDGFDRSNSYTQRFDQFYDAIKARYPRLQLISTVGGKDPLGARVTVPSRPMDVIDEHYYRNAYEMESDADHYDDYNRNGSKIFVGEWATREGSPTTNFNAALGDAAWMTGMERNSDIVVMSCYAPLFVNVSPGAMQWKSDLIGYNTMDSYGSPSYYAQKMFNTYLGDKVIAIEGNNIPQQWQKLDARDSAAGKKARQIPALFYVATRDSKTGTVYLKIVNTQSNAQAINIKLPGASKVANAGQQIVLKANGPLETNTIEEPKKIIPVVSPLKKTSKDFTYNAEPYSITVLQLETK